MYMGTVSLFVVLSDTFFITFTLTSPTLRQNVANWFLVGFSVSDQLHCMSQCVSAYAIYTGSVEDRRWCSTAGLFVLSTATCSFGFPALIAADRYYKISTISQSSGFLMSKTIFGKRMIIPLMVGWYFFAALLNLPLMLTDAFGEDPSGFCGAKKFTSVPLMLSYEFSMIFIFAGALTTTVIYYYRLAKFLKQHQSTTRGSKETMVYTQNIMRLMKIVTLVPVFTATPVVVLSAGQMILPAMPMWLNRLLSLPYMVPPAANPWLTICLVRQYRVCFRQLVCSAKKMVIRNPTIPLNNSQLTPAPRM